MFNKSWYIWSNINIVLLNDASIVLYRFYGRNESVNCDTKSEVSMGIEQTPILLN